MGKITHSVDLRGREPWKSYRHTLLGGSPAMTRTRHTATEERIREALCELLPQRSIEGITVSDIARAAGINRGTFYMHYTDKFDLVGQQVDRIMADLAVIVLDGALEDEARDEVAESGQAAVDAAEDAGGPTAGAGAGVDGDTTQDLGKELIPYDNVLAALTYVRDNRTLIAALSANGTDATLMERTKELIGQLIEHSAARQGRVVDYGGIPSEYGREMMLSGVAAVIWLWLRRGCPEEPRFIADLIFTSKAVPLEHLVGTPIAPR